MKLHERISTVQRPTKRVGRGYGSGKGGHNSGRGTKGQKARGKVPAHFVGSSWVWFKRLPFIRGKSKFEVLSPSKTITLNDLSKLKTGTVVTNESLWKAGIISKSEAYSAKLKVVGTGKLATKLTLKIAASASAIKAVEKAGGEYSVKHT